MILFYCFTCTDPLGCQDGKFPCTFPLLSFLPPGLMYMFLQPWPVIPSSPERGFLNVLLNESILVYLSCLHLKTYFKAYRNKMEDSNHRVFSLDVFFPVSSICRKNTVKHIFLASVNRNRVTRAFKKGVEITYESPY